MKNISARNLNKCILLALPILAISLACSKGNENNNFAVFTDKFDTRVVGITIDSKSNMYVGTIEDNPQKRILKITPSGEISTFLSIECFAIEFINAGKNDSLYLSAIIDSKEGGAKIFKIGSDAGRSIFADSLTQPVGMAFDLSDNLLVVDAMNKKVYKITQEKEKSVFIDLGNIEGAEAGNYYHGIEIDPQSNYLLIAGLNNNGKGNLLKFTLRADGSPENPVILSDHYSKHVAIYNDISYTTVDSNGLLIINSDGSKENISDPLILNGMNLCPGIKQFGENKLYINTFDKIVIMTIK